jgi:DNA polymerase-3 subunit epsilon
MPQKQIVFFDLETTGTDVTKDRIVQYCFHNLYTNEVLEGFLHPGVPIPASASEVHGITDDSVKDKPLFKDVAHEILKFITGADLGGHNIKLYDFPLLYQEFERAKIQYTPDPDIKFFDTLEVYRKYEPHTLSKAFKFYTGKTLEGAHGAYADVKGAIDVYLAQKTAYMLTDQDFETGKYPDLIGRLILINGVICYNFGKYQGQPVTKYPDYATWMINSDFPSITKSALRKALSK